MTPNTKPYHLVFIFILVTTICFGQEKKEVDGNQFYADFIMGPYLMIDHHLYKSVFLKGPRLGYHISSRFSLGLEYMVGQQDDTTGASGTTHTANGQVFYYFHDRSSPRKFSPYLIVGGGFIEFKDFSDDVYGVAFYGGAGFNFPIYERFEGFFESRYVNLGPLDLAGQNEIAVLWGLRVNF